MRRQRERRREVKKERGGRRKSLSNIVTCEGLAEK